MKFVIEVDDFYLNEGELSVALKTAVTREVIKQISEAIKVKVEETITTRVNEAMQKKMLVVIDKAIGDFIATGTITVNKQPVKLIEHLRKLFDDNHGWNNPHEKMKEIAKRFGEECKAQYNNIFAAKIVTTMKEQGFLKDDMARILLGDTKA